MNETEKYVARLILRNKIHESNGAKFEDLFTKVMTHSTPGFTPVKPQGSIGDRKNDGFDRENGVYYQVYAPEDIKKSYSKALSKLKEDFKGLSDYWEEICKIQEFYYVVNDKFQGIFPELEKELAQIKEDNELNSTGPFIAKDLERLVFELEANKVYDIVGYVPTVENIGVVKISAMNDAARFLFDNRGPVTRFGKLVVPDFHEKIDFNRLSVKVGSLLNTYNYQTGTLDEYFTTNGDISKDQLRNIFSSLYENAKHEFSYIEDETERGDQIFFHVLDKSCPESCSKEYQDAVLVMMSYFFETCDIFEEPVKE